MYYQLKQLDWGSVSHISLFVEICGRQKGQQGGRVIFWYINVQHSCTKMQRYVDFFALAALSVYSVKDGIMAITTAWLFQRVVPNTYCRYAPADTAHKGEVRIFHTCWP